MVTAPSRIRSLLILVAAGAIAASGSATTVAAVVGNWDFATASLAPGAGIPGTQLSWLPATPIYSAFGGPPNPPPLVFATTGSFGVASLAGGDATVLRVPDMRGRGPAVGMMASFPLLANGTTGGGAPATKLNRYTFVTDVLVPAASFAVLPNYLDLFQPRGNADGSLFVRKPSNELGAAVGYAGQILPNTWNRIAMVMQLDAAESAPRYQTYVNGILNSEIIWDQIVVDSNRNAQLKDFDLVPDGTWSVGPLSDTEPSLPATASGFFAFNDNNNEVGELYVANMLFRDDALSATDVAALGGPAPGLITSVPEPSAWGAGLAALGLGGVAVRGRRRG